MTDWLLNIFRDPAPQSLLMPRPEYLGLGMERAMEKIGRRL